jgi:hypothetical protein
LRKNSNYLFYQFCSARKEKVIVYVFSQKDRVVTPFSCCFLLVFQGKTGESGDAFDTANALIEKLTKM